MIRNKEFEVWQENEARIEIRSRKTPMFDRIQIPAENLRELKRLYRKSRKAFGEKCQRLIELQTLIENKGIRT